VKKVLCLLPVVMLLWSCDLTPKVSGAVHSVATGREQRPPPGTVAHYGTPATDLYGRAEPEHVSKNDFILKESPDDYRPPPPPAPTPAPEPRQSESAPPRPASDADDPLLVPARIAAAPPPTIIAPETSEVTVQRGDTVFSISRRTNVPVRDLIEANNLRPPYTLAIGQKLQIPGARFHTVRAGETLYSISRAYSVDLSTLARENNIEAPFGLAVGQRLRLPATVTTMAATRTADTPAAAAAPAPAEAPTITETRTVSSRPTGRLPATPARAGTRFAWPVQGRVISPFGAKPNGLFNDGINISARAGTAVRAAENGVIAYAGNELRGMGNLIIIQHAGGWMTVYGHLDTMTVRRGARVNLGEKIGTVGSTGRVTEPQLNFQIRRGTKAYNPTTQLRR